MKKSINQWSFPAGMNLRAIMEMAKNTGYDCFEPAFDEKGELSMESTDQQIIAIRDMAQDLGLPLCSLASGLYWSNSPTDNDPRCGKGRGRLSAASWRPRACWTWTRFWWCRAR